MEDLTIDSHGGVVWEMVGNHLTISPLIQELHGHYWMLVLQYQTYTTTRQERENRSRICRSTQYTRKPEVTENFLPTIRCGWPIFIV